MTIDSYAKSISTTSKPINEDAYIQNDEMALYAVLDGLSGHGQGDLASGFVRDRLTHYIKNIPETPDERMSFFQETISKIDQELFALNKQKSASSKTTLAFLHIFSDAHEIKGIIGSCGDSRLYRFRNNRLEQITEDDDLLAVRDNHRQKDFPQIDLEHMSEDRRKHIRAVLDDAEDGDLLTAEEFWFFMHRGHMSAALGKGEGTAKFKLIDVIVGDIFILATDGVSDNLTKSQIAKVIQDHNTLSEQVDSLTDFACERSTAVPANVFVRNCKRDDITVVGLKIL
jgi:serine/threonine protein phosphatase PrpC